MNDKVIMDTNVPAKAAALPQECRDEELDMQKACMEYVREFTKNPESKLVLDFDYEILKEYQDNIPSDTEMGRIFFKWLYNYLGSMDFEDWVKLEKDENGNYMMFPLETRTKDFDLSDRKFVALSRAHMEHPPIIEAADGKWLGFREVFEQYGVHIEFLDMDYATLLYERKVINKRGS